MLKVKVFPFNKFQENTYIVYDEEGQCAIFDPGMSTADEEVVFSHYIEQEGLKPIALYNTHCHIDHVLGNRYVFEHYGLMPQFHEREVPILVAVENIAPGYGFRYDTSPIPETFLKDGDTIKIGKHELKILFVPGHSPGHLCFYTAADSFIIGGDVLFRNSIGRTDLPGGNHQQLLTHIQQHIYTLPEQTTIYPGHGPSTSIGFEKANNPFVRG